MTTGKWLVIRYRDVVRYSVHARNGASLMQVASRLSVVLILRFILDLRGLSNVSPVDDSLQSSVRFACTISNFRAPSCPFDVAFAVSSGQTEEDDDWYGQDLSNFDSCDGMPEGRC